MSGRRYPHQRPFNQPALCCDVCEATAPTLIEYQGWSEVKVETFGGRGTTYFCFCPVHSKIFAGLMPAVLKQP